MTSFLKGNYELPDKPGEAKDDQEQPKNLSDKFEDSVLAKLGGSICFVTKTKTLLWTGEQVEEPGQ